MIGHLFEGIANQIEGLVLVLPLLGVIACTSTNLDAAAKMPTVDELPDIKKLPDPFLMNNGKRVRSKADWTKRRKEIKAMMLYYQYGHMPPAPKNVTAKALSSETVYKGSATKKHVLLSMGPGRKIKVNVGIIIPKGKGPFPVILKNDSGIFKVPVAEEIIKRGYIVADYNRTDLAPDRKAAVGPTQQAYPDYDWATLAVWAWGGMRVIDYLLTLDVVDKKRIAFTGH
ncbi:MAG: hypothetical protein PVF96_08870, partial [Candidatus Bathyarchaeota archaeon]